MTGRRVAILGGGMAGVTAAWHLSKPGWRDRFESITIYQRGHRLGGKGASSRGVHGRIEEHGLHVWLGHYGNAFRLMREVYEELDRDHTDPDCPIRSVDDAFERASVIGLEHHDGAEWRHWIADFDTTDEFPGGPVEDDVAFRTIDGVRRVLRLAANFYSSLDLPNEPSGIWMTTGSSPPSNTDALAPLGARALVAAAIEAIGLATAALSGLERVSGGIGIDRVVALLDDVLDQVRAALRRGLGDDADALRTWQLISVVLAQTRGVIADGLLVDRRRFRGINDLEFREWVVKHGADPEAAESTFVRGLYSLVFGYHGADTDRPAIAAGTGSVMANATFFDYRGALFWKMTAGMGDVVFAPLHEALVRRGVAIEYFSRVDALHLSDDRRRVDSIAIPCQVALADGFESYDPLVRFDGLPCYPSHPVTDRLADAAGVADHDLESHWCEWPDADDRVLRRGVDFDDVVLAIPPGMARLVCAELVDDRPEWREMVDGLGLVGSRSLQLWLREDEPTLGWHHPGSAITAYAQPFDTWASMPQLIAMEQWPDDDRPRSIAYFCNVLSPPTEDDLRDPTYPVRRAAEVRGDAERFIRNHLAHLLPGIADAEGSIRWDLLCGAGRADGAERIDSQYWRANVDPSDLYVQSLPGTDRLRLDADGSGYENLYLAGDWTDNGINAGCIEAAVISGLRAANVVSGQPIRAGITGHYLD